MVTQQRETPSESLILSDETQKGFDETGNLPARLQRYSLARQRALVNLTHLDDVLKLRDDFNSSSRNSLVRVHSRLQSCGNYLNFRDFYTVGKVRLYQANFCKVSLLCPLCAIRRASKNLESYLKRYRHIMSLNPLLKLSLLTLTVKNGDDLTERFNHIQKSLKTVLERRKHTVLGMRGHHSEFGKILGLVGSYEVTKGNGWHPHAHLLILHSERLDYQVLKDEWLDITGDSHVLRVDAAFHPDEPERDFLEVFKYAVKFSDLSPDQNFEVYEVLKGRRLLFSAGLFYGVEVPKTLNDDLDDLDGLPFISKLYQYFLESGYNLVSTDEGIYKSPLKFDKPEGRFTPMSNGSVWLPANSDSS